MDARITPARRRTVSKLHVAVLVTVAVAAATAMLVATRTWGLGVSYDSVVYVQASRSLSSIDLPQPRDEGGEPLYWWAPGYPLALELIGGGYSAARYLNALLLLAGSLLVGGVTWRAVSARAGVTAGALYALSPAIFTAHLDLLAEPLYLVLATASLAAIADRRPVLAGIVTTAAVLTRYAGLPLVLVGAIALRGRDRVRFLLLGVVPYCAWLLRNELVAGQTTGRAVRWHPPDLGDASDALRVIAHFLVTPGQLASLSLPLVDPGRLAQLAAGAIVLWALVRADRRDPPRLVELALLYAGLYLAYILLAKAVFDSAVPFDERLLVPLVPPLVIGLAWLLRDERAAAVALCIVFGVATLQVTRTISLYGRDYSGRIWSAASFDGVALPPGRLYSNWPAAVAYFTDRSSSRLPRPTDVHTQDRDDAYDAKMRSLARRVRDGEASLVLLDGDFLQIPTVPLVATPPYRGLCRPATAVITICTQR